MPVNVRTGIAGISAQPRPIRDDVLGEVLLLGSRRRRARPQSNSGGGEPPISGSGRRHGQPRPRLEGVGCVLPQHESATVALSGSCSHPSEGLAGVVYPQSSVAVLKHNGNLTKNPVALVVARFYVSFVEENGRIFYSQ